MKIKSITKLTDFTWLNLFQASVENGKGSSRKWIFASRQKSVTTDPCNHVDAVMIVPIHVAQDGTKRLVLIKEFRVPLRKFEIAFPAGLIENNDPVKTAIKELKEETGLVVTKILKTSSPTFSSSGLTDETLVFVFVECEGGLSQEHLEVGEEIEPFMVTFDEMKELEKDGLDFASKCYAVIQGIISKGFI